MSPSYINYILDMLFIYSIVSMFLIGPTNFLWIFVLKKEQILNDIFGKGIDPDWKQWAKLYLVLTPPFWLLTFLLWNPPIYAAIVINISRLGLLNYIGYYHFALAFWSMITILWYGFWIAKLRGGYIDFGTKSGKVT